MVGKDFTAIIKGSILALLVTLVTVNSQECLVPADPSGVLPFRNDPTSPRLPMFNQVIVTSYQFQCCGVITGWQTWTQPVNPGGFHDLDFQVWRPSPNVSLDGCYSFVGSNYFSTTKSGKQATGTGLISVSVNSSEQLVIVQPGDVFGYTYFNEGGQPDRDQGVQLEGAYTNEEVWYGNPLEFMRGPRECELQVGTETGRQLNLFTNAAPVLSITIETSPCPTPTVAVRDPTTSSPSPLLTTLSNTPNEISNSPDTLNTDLTRPDTLNANSTPSKLSTGAIAGISVGGLVMLIAVMVIVFIGGIAVGMRIHRTRSENQNMHQEDMERQNTYSLPRDMNSIPRSKTKENIPTTPTYNAPSHNYDRASMCKDNCGEDIYTYDYDPDIPSNGNQAYGTGIGDHVISASENQAYGIGTRDHLIQEDEDYYTNDPLNQHNANKMNDNTGVSLGDHVIQEDEDYYPLDQQITVKANQAYDNTNANLQVNQVSTNQAYGISLEDHVIQEDDDYYERVTWA